MNYRLNFDEIADTFFVNEIEASKFKLKHKTGSKFKLLPFTVKEKNATKNLNGVIAELSRQFQGLKKDKNYSIDRVIEDAINKININDEDRFTLRDILEDFFITTDEDGNRDLFPFNLTSYAYINSTNVDNKVAKFLYDILYDRRWNEKIKKKFQSSSNNVLYELMFNHLPKLQDNKESTILYTCLVPQVRKVFNEDFKYVIDNDNFLFDNFDRLMSYYYFFYISQLSMNLNNFFNEKEELEKFYFTLNWESLSKSRSGYDLGWNLLANNIESLFAHANTLEFINHLYNSEQQLNYLDFKKLVNQIDNKELLLSDLKRLTDEYKKRVGDINFPENSKSHSNLTDPILLEIVHLYVLIKYQFDNSKDRNRAYKGYKNWFEIFCKDRFLKRRGNLGYSLNLNEDDIIFLTKLIIKENEKIRLTSLFKGFENRGIAFDLETKRLLISYYDKLNLLEKKSDSGDAQYIKGVL